jgi:RimJ/RimL family protein N-acetyltransferase
MIPAEVGPPPPTARLKFSRFEASDAAFVLALVNEPAWLANIGDRGLDSLETAQAYIAEVFAVGCWFRIDQSGGEPIGLCGVIFGREGLDCPDLGYALLTRWHGQGYATEAAGALLAHARTRMGLARLAAVTAPSNLASQRVLEKIGFAADGTVQLPGRSQASALFRIG